MIEEHVIEPTAPDRIWTLPNVITLMRILLVPLFVVTLLSPWPEWFGIAESINDYTKAVIATGAFICISCTDWIDGYLARKRNQVSDFGKFIDPLADKILVAAALLALVELQTIPAWPVIIILSREFIVSGARMLAASKDVVIAASWYGKAKTVLQIAAIVLFLVKAPDNPDTAIEAVTDPVYIMAWLVMLAALVMTIVSMMDYLSKCCELFGFHSKKPNRRKKHQRPGDDDAILAEDFNEAEEEAESESEAESEPNDIEEEALMARRRALIATFTDEQRMEYDARLGLHTDELDVDAIIEEILLRGSSSEEKESADDV